MAKCLCGCGDKLVAQKKKYASKECQNKYERMQNRKPKDKKPPKNVRSQAPFFRKKVRAENVGEWFSEPSQDISGFRKLAFAIVLGAVKNIEKRSTSVQSGSDWKSDLNWIHSRYSSCDWWCDMIDLDIEFLRKKFPANL